MNSKREIPSKRQISLSINELRLTVEREVMIIIMKSDNNNEIIIMQESTVYVWTIVSRCITNCTRALLKIVAFQSCMIRSRSYRVRSTILRALT